MNELQMAQVYTNYQKLSSQCADAPRPLDLDSEWDAKICGDVEEIVRVLDQVGVENLDYRSAQDIGHILDVRDMYYTHDVYVAYRIAMTGKQVITGRESILVHSEGS